MHECYDLQNLKGKAGKGQGKHSGKQKSAWSYSTKGDRRWDSHYDDGWVQPVTTEGAPVSVPLFALGMLTCEGEPSTLCQVDGQQDDEWECLESMLDSGAARSVCPLDMCKELGVEPGEVSPAYFRTATGARVANHGTRKIRGCARDGTALILMYNVADVSTPLDSVSQICDKGNIVVFTANGGYICGPHGRLGFRRRNDTYVRETWVQRPRKSALRETTDMQVDFPRPGAP